MKIIQYYPIPENRDFYLDCYICCPQKDFTRDALLVIPGGGYGGLCVEREGEAIAQAFIPYGYNCFVLHYSCACNHRIFPAQLIEASIAMRHIRENAEEYGINPDRVFAVGFSAGAHLAGSLGILWNLPEVASAVGGTPGCNRPEGVLLCYPVVSGDPAIAHMGSFRNLFGTGKEIPAEELRDKVSLEKHVSADSAPAFLIHTSADELVNVRNSLELARAYHEAGKTFELHIYPDGPHGMSLANEITAVGCAGYRKSEYARWVELAADWMNRIKRTLPQKV